MYLIVIITSPHFEDTGHALREFIFVAVINIRNLFAVRVTQQLSKLLACKPDFPVTVVKWHDTVIVKCQFIHFGYLQKSEPVAQRNRPREVRTYTGSLRLTFLSALG